MCKVCTKAVHSIALWVRGWLLKRVPTSTSHTTLNRYWKLYTWAPTEKPCCSWLILELRGSAQQRLLGAQAAHDAVEAAAAERRLAVLMRWRYEESMVAVMAESKNMMTDMTRFGNFHL